MEKLNKLILGIVVFILSLGVAHAENGLDLNFGESPTPQMKCIKGLWAQKLSKDTFGSGKFISIYEKDDDIEKIAHFPISSPRYEFFNHTYFRTSFQVFCKRDDSDAVINKLALELKSVDGFVLKKKGTKIVNQNQAFDAWWFKNDFGVTASVLWLKEGGKWNYPVVSIFNDKLIDEIRHTINPSYSNPLE